MLLPKWAMNLRTWQQTAFDKWLASSAKDYLVVGAPGSGKTRLALRIAHFLLETGHVKRIVVVTPTDHLRKQWAGSADKVGIRLDPELANKDGKEFEDFHGAVITYQSVASAPLIQRVNCSNLPTLVILDEIHHAGDQQSWGLSLLEAFGPAAYRLSLSGTPFRSEGGKIPFIRYENDKSMADFPYHYGDALANGDCRLVLFPHYEGRMEWFSNGKPREATFAEKLSEEEASRRLRTALDVRGEWLPSVIKEAHAKLIEVRTFGHPSAGGLIIAVNTDHARAIADLVRKVTGTEPLVVTYEDKDASDKIREFESSSQHWIIAVRMVSEGVDIPRLRVGVYATNVISELFFRQFVGRFVRVQPGLEEQTAYVYIPAEEDLVAYAQAIKEERDHVLEQVDEDEEEKKKKQREPKKGQDSFFFSLGSSEGEFKGTIHERDILAPEELVEGKRFIDGAGIKAKLDDLDVVQLWRHVKTKIQTAGRVVAEPEAPAKTAYFEQRKKQKGKVTNLVRVLAIKLRELFPDSDGGRQSFKLVNWKLKQETGAWPKDANPEVSRRQQELLAQWLHSFREAEKRGMITAWAEEWGKTAWGD